MSDLTGRQHAAALPFPFVFLSLLALTTPAQADLFPSTATDVQSQGACRSDATLAHSAFRMSSFSTESTTASAGLSCGVSDRVALGAAASHLDGEGWNGKSLNLLSSARLLGNAGSAGALTLLGGVWAGKYNAESFRYQGAFVRLAARHLSSDGHRWEASLAHYMPREGSSGQSWDLSYGYLVASSWEVFARTEGAFGSKPAPGVGVRWNASAAWQFAAQLDKPRHGDGLASTPVGRALAARWTPDRAWQLTSTLRYRANGHGFSGGRTDLDLKLRHDF